MSDEESMSDIEEVMFICAKCSDDKLYTVAESDLHRQWHRKQRKRQNDDSKEQRTVSSTGTDGNAVVTRAGLRRKINRPSHLSQYDVSLSLAMKVDRATVGCNDGGDVDADVGQAVLRKETNVSAGIAFHKMKESEAGNSLGSATMALHNAIIMNKRGEIIARTNLTDIADFPPQKWSVKYQGEIVSSNPQLKCIPAGPDNAMEITANSNRSFAEAEMNAANLDNAVGNEEGLPVMNAEDASGGEEKTTINAKSRDNLDMEAEEEEKAMGGSDLESGGEKSRSRSSISQLQDIPDKLLQIIANSTGNIPEEEDDPKDSESDSAIGNDEEEMHLPEMKALDASGEERNEKSCNDLDKEAKDVDFFGGGRGGFRQEKAGVIRRAMQTAVRRVGFGRRGGGTRPVHATAKIVEGGGDGRRCLALQTARRGGCRRAGCVVGGGMDLWKGRGPGPVSTKISLFGGTAQGSTSTSLRLKDLEGRTTTKLGYWLPPGEKEIWMAFAPGCNIIGECMAPNCVSQRWDQYEKPMMRIGYGRNFRLRRELLLCPACSNMTFKPGKVLVSVARSLLNFKKAENSRGTSIMLEHLGSFPSFVTQEDENDEVDYDVVEITTVKPKESPFTCSRCRENLGTKANEVRKECGHRFCKKCCSQTCPVCGAGMVTDGDSIGYYSE